MAGLVYVNDSLEFIPTAEGRLLPPQRAVSPQLNGNTAAPAGVRNTFYRYEYQINDHLGNLRVACRCGEKSGVTTPDDAYAPMVGQENHYDPWGLSLPLNADAEKVGGAPTDRFKFIGRESQRETNWIDLQARFYDPQIGRFLAVDPLAEMFESLSPYNYAENNPVTYLDPDGMALFGVNGASEDETLKRGGGFGSMDKQVIGDCPSCPKDKAYDVYRDSKELFTYDKKTASVYNSKGELSEQAVRPNEATTIGLPWWYSLGAFAENAPQIGLNALKVGVTIPLMTLAFVLTPTPAGNNSTVDQYVLNANEKTADELLPGSLKGHLRMIPDMEIRQGLNWTN